jgi:UDP-N-acetylglucosamine 4-epimerase
MSATLVMPPKGLANAVARLRERPMRWLVTGSAGFIGSHLLETLLRLDQQVVSLDNFATGHRANLEEVRRAVGGARWRRHRFIEADIVDPAQCAIACHGVDVVLHEAALGSVPRSIDDPMRTHAANVTGFVNMLVAARDAGVSRFVYAGSSSTYGDSAQLPKVEEHIGAPLSPYAVTKLADELYAAAFGRCYGLRTVGLRYFNVFGSRQDPMGAYAAVIPRWVSVMLRGGAVEVNGDGETTRDFCHVENVVQANLLAAVTAPADADHQVFNIAVGGRTSLNELARVIGELLAERHPGVRLLPPVHRDFRAGDTAHSQADISKARRLLGYEPVHDVRAGLREALPWYESHSFGTCPSAAVVAGATS